MNGILEIIAISLGYASPLILAAAGGLFSERSGVVNIALEGIMMVGGFAAASITLVLERYLGTGGAAAWIGLLGGILAGTAFSSLHALASIRFKADQVISGTALNILAGGLTVFLCQILFGMQRTKAFQLGISKVSVPFLQDIPVLGTMLFKNIYPTFWLAVGIVLLSAFVLYRLPFGLRLRACGEHPQAAASVGIKVESMRWAGVLISGALAGLAGGVMILCFDIQYTVTSIHGAGFIALACLIFGKWNPFGILGAGAFFGLSQVVSLYTNTIPIFADLPRELFMMLPYVITILALVLFAGKSVGPKAAGEIYDSGKR